MAEKKFNPKVRAKSEAEAPSHSMDEPKRLNKYLSNAKASLLWIFSSLFSKKTFNTLFIEDE